LGFVRKKELADLSSSKFVSRPFFQVRQPATNFSLVRVHCFLSTEKFLVHFRLSSCYPNVKSFFVPSKIVRACMSARQEEIVVSIFFCLPSAKKFSAKYFCSQSSAEKFKRPRFCFADRNFFHQRRPVHGARPIAHNVSAYDGRGLTTCALSHSTNINRKHEKLMNHKTPDWHKHIVASMCRFTLSSIP
jgi:hypothetical protein